MKYPIILFPECYGTVDEDDTACQMCIINFTCGVEKIEKEYYAEMAG